MLTLSLSLYWPAVSQPWKMHNIYNIVKDDIFPLRHDPGCRPGFPSKRRVTEKEARQEERVLTGIYECDGACGSKEPCFSKVAQNGLKAHLEVFLTKRKGWVVRTLADLLRGAFVAMLAGHLCSLEDDTFNPNAKAYMFAMDWADNLDGR